MKTIKKVLVILLVMASMFNLIACNKDTTTTTTTDEGSKTTTDEGDKTTTDKKEETVKGKVGIVTNPVGATEEEYRAAESLAKKYGDRIVHVTWPLNASKEQEQMVTVLTKLGSDKDIKAIVINQAVPGTNAAVTKLREVRDDIVVIYCNFSENPPDVAKTADIAIIGDNVAMGKTYAEQAKKVGAKTIVYYSFPKHMAISIFYENRDLMKKTAEELGIKFVEVTAPDPSSDAGSAGTQQFILEDVPKKVLEYGPDTAFYGTNCNMQIPMIQKCVELKAMYLLPCCASPFHGYPVALGLDIPEDKKGDVDYVIEETRKKLDEAGVLGRFSNFRVPGAYMSTTAATEYALKYVDGETEGVFDRAVMEKCMEDYAQTEFSFRLMEEGGVTYDNVLMTLQGFFTY